MVEKIGVGIKTDLANKIDWKKVPKTTILKKVIVSRLGWRTKLGLVRKRDGFHVAVGELGNSERLRGCVKKLSIAVRKWTNGIHKIETIMIVGSCSYG
jgi:hypothetical protein